MRCEQYKIPATALLLPPLPVPSPDVFFPAWPSLALGESLTGVTEAIATTWQGWISSSKWTGCSVKAEMRATYLRR